MSNWYRLRDDNSPDMKKGMNCSIYKEAWYHVIRDCPDICPWADITVALPVFTYGKNWRYYFKYEYVIIYFISDILRISDLYKNVQSQTSKKCI